MHANYTITNREKGSITIRDMGPWDDYATVTNAAEDVVKELLSSGELKAGDRLFYYDSSGELGELIIKEGKFYGFSWMGGTAV